MLPRRRQTNAPRSRTPHRHRFSTCPPAMHCSPLPVPPPGYPAAGRDGVRHRCVGGRRAGAPAAGGAPSACLQVRPVRLVLMLEAGPSAHAGFRFTSPPWQLGRAMEALFPSPLSRRHWRATCAGGDGAPAVAPYSRTGALLDSQCCVVRRRPQAAAARVAWLPASTAAEVAAWTRGSVGICAGARTATPQLPCLCPPPAPQSKDSVSLGDACIQVLRGRPDVAAELRGAAERAGPGATVGVYAGGEAGAGQVCILQAGGGRSVEAAGSAGARCAAGHALADARNRCTHLPPPPLARPLSGHRPQGHVDGRAPGGVPPQWRDRRQGGRVPGPAPLRGGAVSRRQCSRLSSGARNRLMQL